MELGLDTRRCNMQDWSLNGLIVTSFRSWFFFRADFFIVAVVQNFKFVDLSIVLFSHNWWWVIFQLLIFPRSGRERGLFGRAVKQGHALPCSIAYRDIPMKTSPDDDTPEVVSWPFVLPDSFAPYLCLRYWSFFMLFWKALLFWKLTFRSFSALQKTWTHYKLWLVVFFYRCPEKL